MARAKKVVEPEASPVEAAPDKFVAIAEMIEMIVNGQHGPQALREAASKLSITLKG
jgi:hypothetical protein